MISDDNPYIRPEFLIGAIARTSIDRHCLDVPILMEESCDQIAKAFGLNIGETRRFQSCDHVLVVFTFEFG